MFKQFLMKFILFFALLPTAQAEIGIEDKNSFLQVNVSLDLQGIEDAINNTSGSLDSLSDSLRVIAESDELTPQQQANIEATIVNMNELIDASTSSLEALPSVFLQSKQVVADQTHLFLDDLKFKVLLILGITILALLVIIGCIYLFLLRPLQSTVMAATNNLSEMAKSLQITAQAVEASTEKQQEIAEQLASAK
jgi:hypothetical protein